MTTPLTPASSTLERQTMPGRLKLVLIIGALSAFGPLSLDLYLPSLPALSRELGASASQGQLTLSACLMGLALGQVLAGPLSDTVGRRRPLLLGVAIYALASFLCALAPSVSVLIGLRFLQGVAGAAGLVIARAVVRDIFSGDDIARFFSLTMLVNGLAPILAPIVGAQLLRVTDWRGVFLFLGAIGIGLLLAAVVALPESLSPARRRSGALRETLRTFRHLLADRELVGYGLSSGLAFAAMFAYIAGSPFVLQGLYGVSAQGFSFIFASNALGIIAAGQVSGRLVGRVPLRRLMGIGLGSSVLGSLLLLVAVSANLGLGAVLAGLFLVVASIGLIAPNSTALALANHPLTAGSASALLGVLQYVIGGAVAPIVGSGGSGTALPMALTMAACTIAAVAAFTLLTGRHQIESDGPTD